MWFSMTGWRPFVYMNGITRYYTLVSFYHTPRHNTSIKGWHLQSFSYYTLITRQAPPLLLSSRLATSSSRVRESVICAPFPLSRRYIQCLSAFSGASFL